MAKLCGLSLITFLLLFGCSKNSEKLNPVGQSTNVENAKIGESPIINTLTIDKDTVQMGGIVNLEVNANDPDGDNLAYSWYSNNGGLISFDQNKATWTAPIGALCCTPGTYAITASVDDGNNNLISKTINCEVSYEVNYDNL